jgi:hypothetical protein
MRARRIPHTDCPEGWREMRQWQDEVQYCEQGFIDELDFLAEPHMKLP